MQVKIKYQFSSKLWKYNGQGGWFFVSLPKKFSEEIRASLKWQEEGWGRMKATAKIKELEWNTAIWFDKKADTYLLPIKADIRIMASLKLDELVTVSVSI